MLSHRLWNHLKKVVSSLRYACQKMFGTFGKFFFKKSTHSNFFWKNSKNSKLNLNLALEAYF
jgi:hypothetical protein